MKTEQRYDFRKELLCIHEADIRNFSRRAKEDEYQIPERVKIAAGTGEVLRTAALDFADFLKTSMSVEASVVDLSQEAEIIVDLAENCGVDLGDATSYRGFMVRVDETGIKVFGHDERGAGQALYYLEDVMTFAKAPVVAKGQVSKRPIFSPQMIHSAYDLDEYPDHYLARIAHEGRDAILVFTKDVNMTPYGPLDFNELIRRAAKYGLDVYAYSYLVSEKHPEDPGAEEYYENTYGRLFRECPGLKGVTLVGESVEFPSRDPRVSPGRVNRTAVDGIPTGKVTSGWFPCNDYPQWLNFIKKIIRKYNKDADIVFWTYNWGSRPEQARLELIESLPTDISLQATFEMAEVFDCGDWWERIKDYTLSFEGPGKYFASEAKAAKKRGIRLYSMTNTGGKTWDFGTAPYEPMPQQWMRRFAAMRKSNEEWGLCGIMESHHYGFTPSFISKLGKWSFWTPYEDMNDVLQKILGAEFGFEHVDTVTGALDCWSDAIRYFTAAREDQYGAFRIGPSYPFNLEVICKLPEDEGAMFGNRICDAEYKPKHDYFATLASIRTPREIERLEKMRDLLLKGLEMLEIIENKSDKLCRLINLGKFLWRTVETGIRAKQWYMYKNQLTVEQDRTRLAELIDNMEALLRAEIKNAEETIPLVEADSSLGFEPSMLYMTDRRHLEWKIRQVNYVLNMELPRVRRNIK